MHLAGDVFVGDHDFLAVFGNQSGQRQGDLGDHTRVPQHGDRVAYLVHAGQDDHQTGAVVGHRSLHREARAHRQSTDRGNQWRDADTDAR